MNKRKLGPFPISPIGLGCMNLSYAYGPAHNAEKGDALLNAALDLGYTYFDTATIYGDGENEKLVGQSLRRRRDAFILGSKCGLAMNSEGKREINGRPELLKQQCDDSLKRLGVEVIDLYYLHRHDRRVPIEDSVGALGELVQAGKIRAIGLSEVPAETLRRGHKEHPIAALQNEYSLWTRNPEIAPLQACKELGITFVAFSPLTRGYLTGNVPDADHLPQGDIRKTMPRFLPDNYKRNRKLVHVVADAAAQIGATPAQLLLAWLLSRGEHVVPIPGTTNIDHMRENFGAVELEVPENILVTLNAEVNQDTVVGNRYAAQPQADVDTERFPNEED